MTPGEWCAKLLSRHDLTEPDGRRLYEYRVNDAEFACLKKLLQELSADGIEQAMSHSHFDQAFVIYAAEWWRRHYEGDWGWQGILKSFSPDGDKLAIQPRNSLVEKGLSQWRRVVRTTNLRRSFLGSVAIEGGLPLKQLTTASGGWLQKTMYLITKRFVELEDGRLEAAYVASHYSHLMPKTFQREEVYEILGDMVTAVVRLKKTYDLKDKDNPVEWLNANQPEWKTKFPLPLEDAEGLAVLSGMVKVAVASSQQDGQGDAFIGVRYLERVSIDRPQLCFELHGQTFYRLRDLFKEDDENIPQRLQLELFTARGKSWQFSNAYRVQWKDDPALKISRNIKQIKGEETAEAIRLRFCQPGNFVRELDIAEGLDPDVPWVFAQKGERWELVGQASQKLTNAEAVVWVPEELTSSVTSQRVEKLGKFLDGALFKIGRDLTICLGDEVYSIKVNQQEETSLDYWLTGKRFPCLSKPADLFVGKPELRSRNRVTDETDRVRNHLVRTRLVGVDADWVTLDDAQPGINELQIVTGNEIMYRRRFGFLPAGTSIKHVAGSSAREGSIRVDRLGEWQFAHNECQNIRVAREKDGSDLVLNLRSNEFPPADFTFQVWKKNLRQAISLTVPYPSSGAILIDPQGDLLSTKHAELFAEMLHGYRLRFFPRRPGMMRIALRLQLIDDKMPEVEARDLYVHSSVAVQNSVELPLIHFIPDIKSLFAISVNLDARVRLSLVNEGAECICLRFRRFRLDIEHDQETGEVRLFPDSMKELTVDEISGLKLEATHLSRPQEAPESLQQFDSQGVPTGRWQFAPRIPGPWLIYSSADGHEMVRPLLLDVPDNPLVAISFSGMAGDSNHRDWTYLSSLWYRFKHLPVSTLPIWKEAVSDDRFLAAMVIYEIFDAQTEMLDRLEDELPVVWELIPLSTWMEILEKYRSELRGKLDDTIAASIVDDAIKRLSGQDEGLDAVAYVVRQKTLGNSGDAGPEVKPEVAKSLISGSYQEMRQRHADEKWPALLEAEIRQAYGELPYWLRDLAPGDVPEVRTAVTYLPFVLAHGLFTGDRFKRSPDYVFKLRRLKLFDESWYGLAFRCACGFLAQRAGEL